MPITARVQAFLEKPIMAAVFFLGGVTWDSLTLTRIDRLLDNAVLLLYLVLLGILIVMSARTDWNRNNGTNATADAVTAREGAAVSWMDRMQPYYRRGIQFLLGGLFSAYAIFYSKSASLTSTGVFLMLLVVLLVGNEFVRDRLTNVRLLVGLYSLVSLSFFTFFLPVITRAMNTWIFLVGAVLSAGLTVILVRVIYRGLQGVGARERVLAGLPGLALVGLLVGFYFLNLIPPVPLSLRFGGVYHEVAREDGSFRLTYYSNNWYRFWQRSDDPFRGAGPVYCFTAVFAPVDLHTTIYHRWQFRPLDGKGVPGYSTTDRIGFPIAGGRDDGYRGYTVKQAVTPGDWRVDVETAEGHILGRVSFRVEAGPADAPYLKTIVY